MELESMSFCFSAAPSSAVPSAACCPAVFSEIEKMLQDVNTRRLCAFHVVVFYHDYNIPLCLLFSV